MPSTEGASHRCLFMEEYLINQLINNDSVSKAGPGIAVSTKYVLQI